jgi:hypothetical protein
VAKSRGKFQEQQISYCKMASDETTQAKGPPAVIHERMDDIDAVRMEKALGHKQELVRGYGLLSLTALGIVIAKYNPALATFQFRILMDHAARGRRLVAPSLSHCTTAGLCPCFTAC